MLGALVALSTWASIGPTFAQDEGGGASDSSAASTPDTTPAPAAAPDAAAPAAPDDATVLSDAEAAALGCPAGSTKGACAAINPFAGGVNTSSYDNAPPAGGNPSPNQIVLKNGGTK
jgi:hypothetical protein